MHMYIYICIYDRDRVRARAQTTTLSVRVLLESYRLLEAAQRGVGLSMMLFGADGPRIGMIVIRAIKLRGLHGRAAHNQPHIPVLRRFARAVGERLITLQRERARARCSIVTGCLEPCNVE